MATTRPRIGELLLARGVCTREQLREAWEQKVLYGDRLGTNLLALGYVQEQDLAEALGQQLGAHSGHGGVIAPDKNALKLVPKNLAVKRMVVPHHVADRQLFLMMRDPLDAIAVDEVAFASSMKVTPVVVCEARMWQLLEVHYAAVTSLRPVPLDGVVRVHRSALEDATSSVALGPELTSEDDFQRLYARAHGNPAEEPDAEPAAAPPPVHAPIGSDDEDEDEDDLLDRTSPARPAALLAERDPGGEQGVLAPPRANFEENDWRDTIEHTQPMMARPRFLPSEQGDEPEQIIDLVEVTDSFSPEMLEAARGAPAEATTLEPPLVRQQTQDFHVEPVEPVEPVDDSPLSFADATRLLHTASDRTAIARIVLRAARTRFSRACLLAVYPDRLVGWVGLGEGMESERLRDVVMRRDDRSVFSRVAESRSHHLGPLARLPEHGAWVKATGRQIPKSLAVFPILVRGRPVNLLVVDNGHDQNVDSDVGEVLILAQQIAKTYETLLTSA